MHSLFFETDQEIHDKVSFDNAKVYGGIERERSFGVWCFEQIVGLVPREWATLFSWRNQTMETPFLVTSNPTKYQATPFIKQWDEIGSEVEQGKCTMGVKLRYMQ